MIKEDRKKKYEDPEKRLYNQKTDLNSCLHQAFANLKQERNQFGWNKLIEELNGITLRRRGTDMFEVSYHKIYTGLSQDILRHDQDSKKFLDEVIKELKSHFRKLSGKSLEVKKLEEDRSIEKYSRLFAESTPLFAGNS